MNIGDKVKLKDIPENDRAYLSPLKGIAGTIINVDNASPPEFLRVLFLNNIFA